ncbi:hypothetical protein BTR23_16390 [Alkalihalophilus pseudofirmus]|nr:hypothetical protein BTR23_16390 [Alkalihalophilus pseudofirmus]
MSYSSFLEEVRGYGSELLIKGEKLIVMNAYSLPHDLLAQLKQNKEKYLESLRNDELASKEGFIIGISGLLYECSLYRNSSVYLEKMNNKWFTWRETYQNGKSDPLKVKTIENGNEFQFVLLKARNYINFVKKQ